MLHWFKLKSKSLQFYRKLFQFYRNCKYTTKACFYVLILIIIFIFTLTLCHDFSVETFLASNNNLNEALNSEFNIKKNIQDQLYINPPDDIIPESSFTLEHIPQEKPDTIFNQTFANLINRYEKCSISDWQTKSIIMMRQVLKFWIEIANIEKIPFMLAYGSLLGYARDKNFNVFDADMDVYVPSWAYRRLYKYSATLPIRIQKDKFLVQLNTNYRHVPLNKQQRYSCNGQISPKPTGLCWLSGNMGRVSLNHRHLDLFGLDHFPKKALAVITKDVVVAADADMFFPPRKCTFMGLPVFCPNNYIKLLRSIYSPKTSKLIPNRICVNNTWKLGMEVPEEYAIYLEKWREAVGGVAADEEGPKGNYTAVKAKHLCSQLAPDVPKTYAQCNDSFE